MKNKVLFGDEMKEKLLAGMHVVHHAVSATMGAAGKNSIYRSDYSTRPVSTNDGITIARRIALEDEAEAMGAELITQAAERTNEEAGDGTTTAIVLTHAMIEKGLEKVKAGANAMILRKQMQNSVERLVKKIKEEISKPIKTDEELLNIANISMENLPIAKIIASAVKKVGEDGIVLVEESAGISIERKDIDGLKFEKGYITPYMATNMETMEAVLTDIHVLVTDKSFQFNKDLFGLFDALVSKNVKKLLIVCSGMQGELLANVIANRVKGNFHCVVVEKPHDENVLEDISILTGAENLSGAKAMKDITENSLSSLGHVDKIVVTKDSTLLVGGKGDKAKIKDRVTAIKKEIEETESPYAKERFKERVAKLVGGLVILKVGAPTEAEMKYMKLKVDDAVASTRAAIQEGIVIGGGKTLLNLSLEKPLNDGDEVVKHACSLPSQIIMKNAGFSGVVAEDEVFNALTGKLTKEPMKDGIVDPAKVERCALQNAVSLAGIFLTTESLIVDIPDTKSSAVV